MPVFSQIKRNLAELLPQHVLNMPLWTFVVGVTSFCIFVVFAAILFRQTRRKTLTNSEISSNIKRRQKMINSLSQGSLPSNKNLHGHPKTKSKKRTGTDISNSDMSANTTNLHARKSRQNRQNELTKVPREDETKSHPMFNKNVTKKIIGSDQNLKSPVSVSSDCFKTQLKQKKCHSKSTQLSAESTATLNQGIDKRNSRRKATRTKLTKITAPHKSQKQKSHNDAKSMTRSKKNKNNGQTFGELYGALQGGYLVRIDDLGHYVIPSGSPQIMYLSDGIKYTGKSRRKKGYKNIHKKLKCPYLGELKHVIAEQKRTGNLKAVLKAVPRQHKTVRDKSSSYKASFESERLSKPTIKRSKQTQSYLPLNSIQLHQLYCRFPSYEFLMNDETALPSNSLETKNNKYNESTENNDQKRLNEDKGNKRNSSSLIIMEPKLNKLQFTNSLDMSQELVCDDVSAPQKSALNDIFSISGTKYDFLPSVEIQKVKKEPRCFQNQFLNKTMDGHYEQINNGSSQETELFKMLQARRKGQSVNRRKKQYYKENCNESSFGPNNYKSEKKLIPIEVVHLKGNGQNYNSSFENTNDRKSSEILKTCTESAEVDIKIQNSTTTDQQSCSSKNSCGLVNLLKSMISEHIGTEASTFHSNEKNNNYATKKELSCNPLQSGSDTLSLISDSIHTQAFNKSASKQTLIKKQEKEEITFLSELQRAVAARQQKT